MREAGSIERVCAGRMPDAIIDSGASAGMGFFGSVGMTTNELALGGRSPAVLIVREHYYRLCEMYTNLNLPAEMVIDLFKESLPLIMQALQNNTPGSGAISSQTASPPPPIPDRSTRKKKNAAKTSVDNIFDTTDNSDSSALNPIDSGTDK